MRELTSETLTGEVGYKLSWNSVVKREMDGAVGIYGYYGEGIYSW